MNVKHVIGLAAIVLGGMTSCSNILEEEGVANTITKGETGELRINLVADGSLNVTTKGTNVSTADIDISQFDVKAIGPSNNVYEGKANTFPRTVPAATYTVEAKYDQMNNEVLKWNAASFSGKAESVTVKTADKGEAIISASLSNSVITFDNKTTTTNFGTSATITEVFVYAGNETYSSEDKKFTLYKKEGDNEPEIETQKLFVAADQNNIYIHIDGFVNDASHTPINHSRLISGYVENDEVINNDDQTYPRNEYKVAYQLVTEKGQLALHISLNNQIDSVPLTFNIDPYPTTE